MKLKDLLILVGIYALQHPGQDLDVVFEVDGKEYPVNAARIEVTNLAFPEVVEEFQFEMKPPRIVLTP